MCGVSFLGNYAQSGTVILEELGAEHVRTGKPILYTSAESVIQIAAHESIVPLDQLYEICRWISLRLKLHQMFKHLSSSGFVAYP